MSRWRNAATSVERCTIRATRHADAAPGPTPRAPSGASRARPFTSSNLRRPAGGRPRGGPGRRDPGEAGLDGRDVGTTRSRDRYSLVACARAEGRGDGRVRRTLIRGASPQRYGTQGQEQLASLLTSCAAETARLHRRRQDRRAVCSARGRHRVALHACAAAVTSLVPSSPRLVAARCGWSGNQAAGAKREMPSSRQERPPRLRRAQAGASLKNAGRR